MPTSVSFSKICQRYKCSFKIFKDCSLRKFSLGSRGLLYKSRPSCNKDNDDGGGGGGSHDNYDDNDDGGAVGGSHDNYDDNDGVGVDGDNGDVGDGPATNIMVRKMVLVVLIVVMVTI